MSAMPTDWRGLYKAGAAAAVALVLIILVQFTLFIVWPPPLEGTVTDWFTLFREHPFRGVMSFEFLMVIYNLVLSVVGVVAFLAARPAFEMLD